MSYTLWKHVAKLRKIEGDAEGAARALRNADAYAGRKQGTMTNSGPETIWTVAARRKHAPQTLPLKDAA